MAGAYMASLERSIAKLWLAADDVMGALAGDGIRPSVAEVEHWHRKTAHIMDLIVDLQDSARSSAGPRLPKGE